MGAAVVAYLLARGIAAVLADRKARKTQRRRNRVIPRNAKLAAGAGVLFVLILMLAFSSWFQVDQGERGVSAAQRQAGARFRARARFQDSFIDSVSTVSVRDHTFIFENLEAYSYDQQPATLQRVGDLPVPAEHVAELYAEYGTISNLQMRVLERKTPDAVKNVFGRYTAVRAIQERQKLGVDVNAAVLSAMDGAPVQIVGVQVEKWVSRRRMSIRSNSACWRRCRSRPPPAKERDGHDHRRDPGGQGPRPKPMRAASSSPPKPTASRLRGETEAASIRAKAEVLPPVPTLVSL